MSLVEMGMGSLPRPSDILETVQTFACADLTLSYADIPPFRSISDKWLLSA